MADMMPHSSEGRDVLFLVPFVTGNQITRAYPFAVLLARRGCRVTLAGRSESGDDIYVKNSHNLEILQLPSLGPLGALPVLRKLVLNHDTICICKPCTLGTLGALLAKLGEKRLVYDIDDDDFSSWVFDLRIDRKRIGLRRTILDLYKGLVILANFAARHLADERIVASRDLSKEFGGRVVYVPLDPADHPTQSYTRRPGEPRRILYAGVIRAHKGLETLVDSFMLVKKQITNSRLVLIGAVGRDLPIARELVEKAEKRSEHIIFEGFKPLDEVARYLSEADCLVVTSPDNPIHRRQTPVKLLHYMAAGRPIVATSIGDVPEILGQGTAGLLVEPGDKSAMAQAIIEILESNNLAISLSEAARHRFMNHYSSDVVAEHVLQLFGFGHRDGGAEAENHSMN